MPFVSWMFVVVIPNIIAWGLIIKTALVFGILHAVALAVVMKIALVAIAAIHHVIVHRDVRGNEWIA